MKLVGFNYKKLSCEKLNNNLKNLKIESKIDIKNIEEIKKEMMKTEDMLLRIDFDYSLEYNPLIAVIEVSGEFFLSLGEKEGKEMIKNWNSKKVDEKVRISLFNAILRKTNVKTLEMEELIGVPPHFQMPSLKPSKKE
jgi:hypothetical protein